MKNQGLLGVAIASLLCGSALADDPVHWGYGVDDGPDRWAAISTDFIMCGAGVNQSPINITETFATDMVPIQVDHSAHANSVLNNGHTLQVNVDPGSYMYIGDEAFELLQFHFHSPSEHQVNGETFPLEAHLVHQNDAGKLAVIGVLFREGDFNDQLAKIGQFAPQATNDTVELDIDLSDMELYSDHTSYYRYNGSLTTPPCTEGVRWFILKDFSHVAREQTDAFISLIGRDNRGPQPLNARIVLEE